MSEFRLAPEAEAELDDIWLHVARESGSLDVANRAVETLLTISGCWLDSLTWAARVMKT